MVKTTKAQRREMRAAIGASNWARNEKVWTLLVASVLGRPATQVDVMRLFLGEDTPGSGHLDIWFEAQPLPPRKGKAGASEGNSRIDLAFGDIARRPGTEAGIAYGLPRPGSWVCFVEAKCLSDCSSATTYDPLRNQLARVIENLLCFQGGGGAPEQLYFTLMTPRLFLKNWGAHLYGYKMREYRERATLLADIERCSIEKRDGHGYHYPDSLAPRLEALKVRWISYEDVLEPAFGSGFDVVDNPHGNETLVNYLRALPEIADEPALDV
jgi:hypothetical protein